jgi:inner membrane protein
VADPFFSIAPGVACIVLLTAHLHYRQRRWWWMLGLILPFAYLGYCSINKLKIDSDAQEIFAKQQIPHERYFTTPAPLNNWLWFVVAGNDSGYYVGFRSLFDSQKKIDFEYFPRNHHMLDSIRDHEDLQHLVRFSQGFYTVEQWSDTLVFNDLRFGQMLGWEQPRGRFVFHYYLQHPGDNRLVVQRGRFKGWNVQVAKGLVKRIVGN